MMKPIIYFLSVLFTGSLYGQQANEQITVVDLKNSSMVIKGKSNVNSFSCHFNTDYLKEYQRISHQKNNDLIHFKKAVLVLNAQGFDCGSRGINRDFQELLNIDEYPDITLELKNAKTDKKKVSATIVIGIAGKQHEYKVAVTPSRGTQSHFKGSLHLKLSDYELSQPKKLFGLIQVKDEIEIDFDIATINVF